MHIIVGLNVGGAEMMLKRLVEFKPDRISESIVVSLTTLGEIGLALRARGVTVVALGLTSLWHAPVALCRLIRLIHQYEPKIVQTWMYHADFLGGLAARLAGRYPVVWNVRSNLTPFNPFRASFWLIRLCALCSHVIPTRIICCAHSARATHIKLGYATHKITVIPNGYDFFEFEIEQTTRVLARHALGIEDKDIVIGIVGRFDPLKDFHNFVKSAALLAVQCDNAKFLMVGRDNDWDNTVLRTWVEQAGLLNKFLLVGQQINVPYFFSTMDIFCLSSLNEAIPSVVIEAMGFGLPCVVTDTGDAAEVLNDARFTVPTKNSAALADALLKMSRMDAVVRQQIGEKNAQRVRSNFSIEKSSECYALVYESAC